MSNLFMTKTWTNHLWKLWCAVALLLCTVGSATVLAQSPPSAPRVERRRQADPTTESRTARAAQTEDTFFEPLYRNFYETYRLGPGDELAIRVAGQPDYTLEHAKISPVGRVYHPLLGDVEVAGLTIAQLHKQFSEEFAEYLLAPKVSVELVEANSAKVGVLGEVRSPGIMVIARPMTVLDAITAAGGFTDMSNRSSVTLLRPAGGRLSQTKLNIKRLLDGKAALEENLALRAGDTVIVHGNLRKKLNDITAFTGFAYFVAFLGR